VSTVSVTGGAAIDELRVCPAGALMTTYTYDPLNGLTSQCDENNRITYYEYDTMGRLRDVKDQDGNVIKTIDYHYRGQ
jgi:YD repeat-containing protein